jgi:uncharacterized protein YehS (DUF1456 family)
MLGSNIVRIDRRERTKKTKKQSAPLMLEDKRPKSLERIKKKRSKKILSLDQQNKKLKKLGSTFGVKAKEVYDLIQKGDMDKAIVTFQRQMLATLMRLIPMAEKEYRKYKKEYTAYALNSLISQARELTSDIQASDDRARLANTLVMDVLKPAFQQSVQEMINTHYALKMRIKSKVKNPDLVEDAVDNCAKEIAQFMNEVFRTTAEQIKQSLTK